MKYLNFKWASDAGHFTTYNKETATNDVVEVGEIIVTDVSYTVKGWDEASNSSIYSNDIKLFRDEPFAVKSKAWILVEWIYKDIKETILNLWAKLHIKVTGRMWEEEISFALKGNNYFQLSETLWALNIKENKLKFVWTEDWKVGAVKFKKTIFWEGAKLTEKEKEPIAPIVEQEEIESPF